MTPHRHLERPFGIKSKYPTFKLHSRDRANRDLRLRIMIICHLFTWFSPSPRARSDLRYGGKSIHWCDFRLCTSAPEGCSVHATKWSDACHMSRLVHPRSHPSCDSSFRDCHTRWVQSFYVRGDEFCRIFATSKACKWRWKTAQDLKAVVWQHWWHRYWLFSKHSCTSCFVLVSGFN